MPPDVDGVKGVPEFASGGGGGLDPPEGQMGGSGEGLDPPGGRMGGWEGEADPPGGPPGESRGGFLTPREAKIDGWGVQTSRIPRRSNGRLGGYFANTR
jgi:hypothetical protein